MSEQGVRIELSADLAGAWKVVRCQVDEALSEPTRAVVEIASDDDLDVEAALGSEATLEITIGHLAVRRWTLCVGSIDFSRIEGGMARYEVELHARSWLLRHTLNTRKFTGLSAQEIVARVLAQHHVAAAWRLTRPTRTREYCVQYAESDFDFVARLLAFEGIYSSFDDDGTMILIDRSSAAAPVEGDTSQFELIDAAGALRKGALGVFELRRGARVAPGRVTVNDFSWKNPERPLLSESAAVRDQELEVYDYPAGFREPGEGAVLAQMRLEAQRVRASFVEGASNVPSFAAGRRFDFGANGGAMFEGEYLLVAAAHEAHDAAFFAEARGDAAPYQNRFRAIPRATPFRPPLSTPRPTVAGGHTAMVRGPAGEDIHTDRFGRFCAQFHWDREAKGSDEDSRWMRLLQESATSMTLARTGWEMSVAYIDGDPDRPVGFARNMNGVMPPAYGQPANKTAMAMRTPSSPATGGFNELKLDDAAGAMLFSVRAERDYAAEVKHDKSEIIGHDETRAIGHDLTHAVGRDQSVVVGHDAKETITGDRAIEIKGDRTKTVAGSEKVDVKGDVTVSTAKDETETVGSVRMTFAGGFHMPDLVARAKGIAKGLVPNPTAIGKGAASAAMSGAVSGAASGALSAAASGALSGATGSLTQSLTSLVPSASGIAGQLTGGLSNGITVGKLADQFLVGSIRRTATEKTSRTVGGAFISAGVGNIATTVSKAYFETVGGVKLTTTMTGAISGSVEGQLATTVGVAVVRTSTTDMTVSSKLTRVTVGGALTLTSAQQLHVVSDVIEIEGLANLGFSVAGAGLDLTPGAASLRGAVQIKAGVEVIVRGKNNDLAT